jgi:hypothetical protein
VTLVRARESGPAGRRAGPLEVCTRLAAVPGKTRLVLLAAAGAVLAACGASGSSTATAPAGRPAAPAARARPAGPRVGATQRVRARGTTLKITVTRVIDPLRGSGATLLPGTRAVGVFVRIRNLGPGEYDSSSTGDLAVVPASGAAAATYAARGSCMTEDRDFDNQIGAGETRQGCVAFALGRSVRLVAVRFTADGGGAGVATWAGRPG